MEKPRLDRSAFSIKKIEEKGKNRVYWMSKTPIERLAASWYLTCCAYNLPYRSDIKLDRTAFRIRNFEE